MTTVNVRNIKDELKVFKIDLGPYYQLMRFSKTTLRVLGIPA
jgi:hypothetical protein